MRRKMKWRRRSGVRPRARAVAVGASVLGALLIPSPPRTENALIIRAGWWRRWQRWTRGREREPGAGAVSRWHAPGPSSRSQHLLQLRRINKRHLDFHPLIQLCLGNPIAVYAWAHTNHT